MITLHPMTQEEFNAFLRISYESFADDLTRADPSFSREAAIAEAKSEVAELLPQGLDTARHHLLSIRDAEETQVGYLWYDLMGASKAFIDDLLIFPAYRRRGHAADALRQLESRLTVPHITLHVFETNHPARCLYEKAGFSYLPLEKSQPGSLYMFKRIR